MNTEFDRVAAMLLELSQRLAAVASINKIDRDQASSTLYDAVTQASRGNTETAEKFIQVLCSQASQLVSEESPIAHENASLVFRVTNAFGDPFWRGMAGHALGKALNKRGAHKEAAQAFQTSIADFGSTYPIHTAVSVGDLGSTFFYLGDYHEAEKLLRVALADALKRDNIHNQLEWKLMLGNTLVFVSRNEEAFQILENGLKQAQAASKHYHESAFLTGLANIYENLGRYDDCIRYHQAALAISRRISDKSSEFHDYLNIGNLHSRFNRFDAALESYQQAQSLANQLGNQALQAEILGAIGALYMEQDRNADAIANLEHAVQLCRAIGNEYSLLRSLGNLGCAYFSIGNFAKAKQLHEESLGLSRRKGDLRSLIWDLANLSEVVSAMGDRVNALNYAKEELELSNRINDPVMIWKAERRVADRLRKFSGHEQTEDTWMHYKRAMDTVETLRRHVRKDNDRIELYSSSQFKLYEEAVSWLLDEGRIELAFEIAERSKSRLMLDVLAERTTGMLSQPENAQQLLARAQTIDSETAVASFFVTNDETILFFLPPGGNELQHKRIPVSIKSILMWFDDWFQLLNRITTDKSLSLSLLETKDKLKELHANFALPLVIQLAQYPQVKRLLLIPHRYLHSAPFHASLDPATERYLAEDKVVTYLPALQLLNADSRNATQKGLQVFVIGEPKTNLPPINNARQEAAAIADLFHVKMLGEKDATVHAFYENAPHANIIHLACHGVFDMHHPGKSYLMMADNTPLTAEAISAMKLDNVELVVAAACESSRAIPRGVDESLGLTRAWLISGARFVLGAQWGLDDSTSKIFMLEFYQRVKSGMNYSDAFGEAQRVIANQPLPYSDPRLWAAFSMVGYTRNDTRQSYQSR